MPAQEAGSSVVTLRASSMDQLFACPPSVLMTTVEEAAPTPAIARDNRATVLGSAVHDMAADMIERGSYNFQAISSTYALTEAERNDAIILMDYVRQLWTEEMYKYFEAAKVERRVRSKEIVAPNQPQRFRLSGTMDVVSPAGPNRAIFLDWKTGRIDDGYHHQMNAYAFCLWSEMGKPDDFEITSVVAFLRQRYYRVVKHTPTKMGRWLDDLYRNVLGNMEYHPGPQCQWCNQFATCQARQALVGGTVDALMRRELVDQADDPHGDVAELREGFDLLKKLDKVTKHDPAVSEAVATLHYRLKLVSQLVDDGKELLKTTAKRVGGIPLPNDMSMIVRPMDRQTLDPERALPALREHLSDQQICKAMKLSLPELKRLKASGAGRGEKKGAINQLVDDLQAASAMKTNVTERLEIVATEDAEAAAADESELTNMEGEEMMESNLKPMKGTE